MQAYLIILIQTYCGLNLLLIQSMELWAHLRKQVLSRSSFLFVKEIKKQLVSSNNLPTKTNHQEDHLSIKLERLFINARNCQQLMRMASLILMCKFGTMSIKKILMHNTKGLQQLKKAVTLCSILALSLLQRVQQLIKCLHLYLTSTMWMKA